MPVAVAAIDILGVKSLLETRSLEEIAKHVAEPFYDQEGGLYAAGAFPFSGRKLKSLGFRRMAGIYRAAISDTIILARRPDWDFHAHPDIACADAVVNLAQYVAKMTKINAAYGIPLRSAISFGECLVSVGTQFALLGVPTREASEWEKCQEWAGGMLAPSAVETLRQGANAAKAINGKDFNGIYPNWLVPYSVPVKERAAKFSPQPCIAINWINSMIPGAALFLKAIMPELHPGAGKDVRRKIANTVAFSEWCDAGNVYSEDPSKRITMDGLLGT